MKTIWKFTLGSPTDEKIIAMPDGAHILCVQVQNGTPCIWVLADPERPNVDRLLKTYGTGHQHDDIPGRYVGTYQLLSGAAVFHVFEEILRVSGNAPD